MHLKTVTAPTVALLLAGGGATTVYGQSQPHWRAVPGGALNGECRALLATTGAEAGGDGSPALWVAGDFTQVGSTPAGRVARMNAAGSWASRGSFAYLAQALCQHNAGSGERVYVGGSLDLGIGGGQNICVQSWSGSGWQLLPQGYLLSWCSSLTSYQLPGEARKLLVSGSPSGSNNYCRALGPSGWEDVGGEFITLVDSALVYDDGSGAELFTTNGTFNGVNKFNGTRRAVLGGNCYSSPHCILAVGEGAARRLVVGGALLSAAGAQVAGLAAWNGTSWSALGGTGFGIYKSATQPGSAFCMTLWDDGSGEKLWVGGMFSQVGSNVAAARQPAQNIATWDPATGLWAVPAAGGLTGLASPSPFYNGAETMAVYDFDGPGGRPPSLVVGGIFTGAGGVPVSNLAVLDAAWCGVADVGRQGGIAKPDGQLDNNDFIAFISLFFDGDARADVGVQGGSAGHDGALDNNDFIAFIGAFFAGCAG